MFKKILNELANKMVIFLDNLRIKFLMNDELERMDLNDVQKFFEDYIGLVIVGFESYREEIDDFDDDLAAKMITAIKHDDENVYIILSKLHGGGQAGQLILSPSLYGLFTAKMGQADPERDSQYKIFFVGDQHIEYLDGEELAVITYEGTE